MIRHVTDVLPWMPAPRWVRNRIQPIAVRDVLYYLVKALDIPADVNRTFDIGGPDVLKYGQMLNGYAVEAKLPQRRFTVLPVLTPVCRRTGSTSSRRSRRSSRRRSSSPCSSSASSVNTTSTTSSRAPRVA